MQELLGHKTATMTLRYAHLSPAHKLAAVQLLNPKATGTTTGTKGGDEKAPPPGGGQVLDLKTETSEPCWISLLKRQTEDDDETHE